MKPVGFCLIALLLGGCGKSPPSNHTAHRPSETGVNGEAGVLITPPQEPAVLPGPGSQKNPPALDKEKPPAWAEPLVDGPNDVSCAGEPDAAAAGRMYPWPKRAPAHRGWCGRFPPPKGFVRVKVDPDSYAFWLRHLPVLPDGTPVRDYRGTALSHATRLALAVVDLDVGKEDLQQCMDTIMRLRAEYGWWKKEADRVKFRYAGGLYVGWSDWRQGMRPEKQGRKYALVAKGGADGSRKNFERYMRYMFAMTGTMHNTREQPVAFGQLAAGDFFVQPPPSPGALGHALVVLDVAKDAAGNVRAVIAQGYTPAQDLHILKAPDNTAWWPMDPSQPMDFPSWGIPFEWSQLARFRH